MVGKYPINININGGTNKIYVANSQSNSVSVIDSNSGNTKSIRVGVDPQSIAVDEISNKIYVANEGSNSVTVIDGYNDSKINDISVRKPYAIAVDEISNEIYVANPASNSISVINADNDTEKHDISLGAVVIFPAIAVDDETHMIYVANPASNSVSVINADNDTEKHDIRVGREPSAIAVDEISNKIYVANRASNSVSVINADNDTEKHDISAVGASAIAVNDATNMIYVADELSNTVSVIDGSSDKVAAGVIFNVNPVNSGKIICNEKEKEREYPTNTYLYVDAGTNSIAQPNKDLEFNTWVESPLTNRNSSIPLQSSGNLTVNRYGVFTVNFKPLPPTIPPEYSFLIISVIISSLIGWSIPSILGWVKSRTQRKHLKECINQIGKLDKNAIEAKIMGYYVEGKLSEDHRQLLKDKISEYYDSIKGFC